MQRNRGFTATDLVVVLGTVTLLIVFMAPRFLSTGCKASRSTCVSNLKQMGVAFRMWANDHGEAFPMAVPFAKGGGLEFALAGEPAPLFRIISKELNTPKVLVCTKDTERFRPNCFSSMTEQNLSYFVGIDANALNPQTILTGDRNLTVAGTQLGRGLARITNNNTVGWSRKIHNQQGNIALGDGSAAQMSQAALQRQLDSTKLVTNHFAVP